MTINVSTINDLYVEYYISKNEMIVDIILKQCFYVKYDSKQNNITINATIKSVDYVFSKNGF